VATIESLLREHVTLRVCSVDRLLLAGHVPRLQTPGQVVWFLKEARSYPIPSPAALGKVSKAYVEAIDRFACENEIPVVRFAKGESKEQRARAYLEAAEWRPPSAIGASAW
jgi:hypothetical protein